MKRPMETPGTRILAMLVWAAAAMHSARTQELVLTDEIITVDRSPETLKMKPGLPKNWLEPVDYYEGKVYFRVEILAAASRKLNEGGLPLPTLKDASGTAAPPTASNRQQAHPNTEADRAKNGRPGEDVIGEWDARLRARLAEAHAAGEKPRTKEFEIAGIDAQGVLLVRSSGLEIKMKWPQLTLQDRKGLAISICRKGTPTDHALAAFYLLAVGEGQVAEEHLREAGSEAQAIRALWSMSDK